MVKITQDYVCQSCGAISSKWQGKCPAFLRRVEQPIPGGSVLSAPGSVSQKVKRRAKSSAIESLDTEGKDIRRIASGIGELDRAVGDGFAQGSAVLLSGEPGIGKSTLLLQAAATISCHGHSALYFSGEEATNRFALGRRRLGVSQAPLGLVAETCVERILATIEQGPPPDFIVIDSIQTLWTEAIDSAPGTVSQVRAGMQALIAVAKSRGPVLVVVGHVTKEGQIAGPKVIEHMVDTVLTFDGENAHNLRLLRATKNRFGPANEIGVFDMHGDGLRKVTNPSELSRRGRWRGGGKRGFRRHRGDTPVPGGIRSAPLAPSPYAAPRRSVVGWDQNRLAMILAVLEARCGAKLGVQDCTSTLQAACGYRNLQPTWRLRQRSCLHFQALHFHAIAFISVRLVFPAHCGPFSK